MRPRAIAAGLAIGTIMGINFDLLITLLKFVSEFQGGPWSPQALATMAVVIPLLSLAVTFALTRAVDFLDPPNNVGVTS